jgi:transcriptional regulator with XRE-family HTH domain
MNIKLRLALIRSRRRQYEVAHDAGISESRLSKLAYGRAIPTDAERVSLATALQCPERDLFDGDPEGGNGGAA